MIRHLLFVFLLLLGQTTQATTYKCVAANGKVAYQATPCSGADRQSQSVLSPPPSASRQAVGPDQSAKKCSATGREISLHFQSMPLFTTLAVIADASGNKLSFAPRLDVSGAFNYDCVPWDSILGDIARRYNLSTKVEAGTIYVRPK
jgi:hypothetical protein